MKKIYAIIGMAGVLMAPSLYAGFDGTLTINWGAQHSGDGGEFLVTPLTGPLTAVGSFETFCVQTSVYFAPGSTYDYDLTTAGVTMGSAWLYNQFLNTLSVNNSTAAGLLQNAIWGFQSQIPIDPTNPYVILADGAIGAGNVLNPSGGAFGVERLVLYDPNNNDGLVPGWNLTSGRQNQLAPVPEPTTLISGALMLLPFGASTLRILRRNRAA
jgi:hypothetical protein